MSVFIHTYICLHGCIKRQRGKNFKRILCLGSEMTCHLYNKNVTKI